MYQGHHRKSRQSNLQGTAISLFHIQQYELMSHAIIIICPDFVKASPDFLIMSECKSLKYTDHVETIP